MIDFFSNDDLRTILDIISASKANNPQAMLERHIAKVQEQSIKAAEVTPSDLPAQQNTTQIAITDTENGALIDDRSKDEKKADDDSEEMYSMNDFVV